MNKPDFLWENIRALPYFRGMLRAVEARFMNAARLPQPTLDIGCGDGHFATVAFERSLEVGIDPSHKTLMEAKRLGGYRLLIAADGSRLPFPDDHFGSVVSNSVLEHVDNLEGVMREIARVSKTGAPFHFTVPNPGYRSELSLPSILKRIRLHALARAYSDWFMRMSRTKTLLDETGWDALLTETGFELAESQPYFSVGALRALEWGHFFGAPTLLPRMITGKWILAPTTWNLWLTDRYTRRYYNEPKSLTGTYTYFYARAR
jgi:SAM-dependent methyltransferase